MKNRSTSRISSVSSETSNPPEKIINKLLQLEAIASTSAAAAAVDVPQPEPVVLSPMEELIKAAKLMNPRQFELPREMNVYVQFPGTDKGE
jgi:hypothetical protein